MVNLLKIAPSTDPVEAGEELISYVKKVSPFADFIHCDIMAKPFVPKDTINQIIATAEKLKFDTSKLMFNSKLKEVALAN